MRTTDVLRGDMKCEKMKVNSMKNIEMGILVLYGSLRLALRPCLGVFVCVCGGGATGGQGERCPASQYRDPPAVLRSRRRLAEPAARGCT